MMIILANRKWPSITAQDVGRELFHRRHDVIRIIGSKRILKLIAWIFKQEADIFEVQFRLPFLLVIRRTGT